MTRQYVAIDLHRRRSVIVREDKAGEELGVVRIDNDPAALAAALAEAGEHPEVAIEAIYGWYWAVDLLEAQGAEVRLVNPPGLEWENRRVKNNDRDCKDLITRMRLHKLPEAWIAPPSQALATSWSSGLGASCQLGRCVDRRASSASSP